MGYHNPEYNAVQNAYLKTRLTSGWFVRSLIGPGKEMAEADWHGVMFNGNYLAGC